MGVLLTASPTLWEKAAATGAGLAKWKAAVQVPTERAFLGRNSSVCECFRY